MIGETKCFEIQCWICQRRCHFLLQTSSADLIICGSSLGDGLLACLMLCFLQLSCLDLGWGSTEGWGDIFSAPKLWLFQVPRERKENGCLECHCWTRGICPGMYLPCTLGKRLLRPCLGIQTGCLILVPQGPLFNSSWNAWWMVILDGPTYVGKIPVGSQKKLDRYST